MAAKDEIDMTLVAELLEQIERNPPGIEMRKILIEQYINANWTDWTVGAVQELYTLCPTDPVVRQWYTIYCTSTVDAPPTPSIPLPGPSSGRAPALPPRPGTRTADPVSRLFGLIGISHTAGSQRRPREKGSAARAYKPWRSEALASNSSHQSDSISKLENLQERYTTLRENAASLLRDLTLLSKLENDNGKGKRKVGNDGVTTEVILENLAAGRITSVLKGKISLSPEHQFAESKPVHVPKTPRALAKHMTTNFQTAGDIAMDDLEKMASLLKAGGQDQEAVRKQLYKRVQDIVAELPAELQVFPQIALMHLDHEIFHKTYANTETMLGDDIADIPREDFLATEDGYAWDMNELQQAITAKKGYMSNPLTKNMFTPADVQLILNHPLGKSLGALQVEQKKLRKGVRPQTIDEMDRIASILLEDMAEDALLSRKAVDEFMAYIATLPAAEQDAIENLRVPAKDSHTRLPFDGSIGETIRDAKANKLCFHKAGDFIRQAASHLRRA